MKRTLLFAAVVSIVAACTIKIEECPVEGFKAPDITAIYDNPGSTKTSLETDSEGVGTIYWNPSDEINVFYGITSTHYVSTNTADVTTAVFTTTDIIGSNENAPTNRWGLYPYNASATCDGTNVTTTLPSSQKGVASSFDDDLFITLAHSQTNEFRFFNVCGGIKFSLSRSDIKRITFKGNKDEDLAGQVKLTMDSEGKPCVSEVLAGEKTLTLTPKDGTCFNAGTYYYIVALPGDMTGGFMMTFETDSQIGTFEYTDKAVEIKRSVFGKKDNIDASAEFKDKYVDLGLSVKWATCNLGASKPEEYGGYYQWAGTEDVSDKSIYLNWENCPYHTGSSWDSGWTKYNTQSSYGTVDNKTTLEASDDAAAVNLGGTWRMPTEAEWRELIYNCTWTWTTLNGIEGEMFTSKKNGNSIFLPAAGIRSRDELHDFGSYGLYWSSSLYTDSPSSAYSVGFNSGGVYRNTFDRYCGPSVRPVYDNRPDVTGVSLNLSSMNLSVGETGTLSAVVTPAEANPDVIWTSSDESIATVSATGVVTAIAKGVATITATTVSGGYTASCNVNVEDIVEDTIEGAVDLGLSVKWAECNLGASKPEEYGGYYQWAGTKDVSDKSIWLDWDNCPYHTGSDEYSGWTKYCTNSSYGTVDNKTRLEASDDAATVNIGEKWRMPTDAEWTELIDNCTWTWTTLNGVNGYMVTSKKNGNSIFLPAAGFRQWSSLDLVGSDSLYWSSSLYTSVSPYCVFFHSGTVHSSNYNRCSGLSVRPVTE